MPLNPILQLLRDNRNAARRFEIKAQADATTIYLYDVIVSDVLTAEHFGGIAPQPFVEALATVTSPVIHLRINSPGGDVFAARAIERAIREHPANIIAHVDGHAASAASLVALAADEVQMAQGAFFMIHRSWTMAFGNAQDLRETAQLLDKVDDSIVDTYVKRSGQSREQIWTWMQAEQWFTAAEAVDAGFAKSISDESAKALWNLAVYEHAPKDAQSMDIPVPQSLAGTDALRRRLQLVQRRC